MSNKRNRCQGFLNDHPARIPTAQLSLVPKTSSKGRAVRTRVHIVHSGATEPWGKLYYLLLENSPESIRDVPAAIKKACVGSFGKGRKLASKQCNAQCQYSHYSVEHGRVCTQKKDTCIVEHVL